MICSLCGCSPAPVPAHPLHCWCGQSSCLPHLGEPVWVYASTQLRSCTSARPLVTSPLLRLWVVLVSTPLRPRCTVCRHAARPRHSHPQLHAWFSLLGSRVDVPQGDLSQHQTRNKYIVSSHVGCEQLQHSRVGRTGCKGGSTREYMCGQHMQLPLTTCAPLLWARGG